MDTESSYPNTDQAIAEALRAQVQAWMAAKPDRGSTTDTGVPVVRRRRMQLLGKQA